MEAACDRFARTVVDRLPAVERELRQVSDALDDRRDELRREVSSLHDEISSADEEDDTSSARSRLEDAEEELASVQRRSRQLAAAGAVLTAQARKVTHLATDHAVRTREFLRGTVDDLKAYFAKSHEGTSVGTGAMAASATVASIAASAPQPAKPESSGVQAILVSSAIAIETHNPVCASSIGRALAAIDEVHHDGVLPRVPVRDTNVEAFGYLQTRLGPQGLTVDHLAIHRSGPWPDFTMVHETGHLLDLEGIGAKGAFATKSSAPVIQDVLKAARNTNAIRGLEQMHSVANSPRQKEYLGYLLTPQEIWARAYAQFVAERSSNLTLKAQLQSALAAEEGRQWTKEEFAPIDAAIEKMFNKLKWL